MPAAVLQERLAHLTAAAEKDVAAPLKILTPDLQDGWLPDLADPADQAALAPYLEDVELVVVDNLSTLVRSGKENESEGWRPVQQWILSLRAAGKSVLLVHHAGKGGQQRGASKKEDILDTVIGLRRPAEYTPDQGAVFEVHLEKARGLFGDEAQPFEAKLEDREGMAVWTTQPLTEATHDKVVRLAEEGLQQKEIAEELELNKSTVSRHLKRAKASGELEGGNHEQG
jgi:putative DNA primase/helicase